MKVLFAGATGAIGRPLLRRLLQSGHEVVAMTRSAAHVEPLRAAGAEPVVCDALDREGVRQTVLDAAPEVVMHQLTALPNRIDPRRIARDTAATNRLRIDGTDNLMAAALEAGVRRFVAQSIAFAYRPGADRPHREADPLFLPAPRRFRAPLEAVAHLERVTVETAGIEGVALRYGFFYGPRTAYALDGSVAQDVRRRRLPLVGKSEGVWSFIHVEDAAVATVLAMTEAPAGIYNVVDDEPASANAWLPHLARLLGAQPPRRLPRWLARVVAGPYVTYLMNEQSGASNAKAKTTLEWSPERSSWREGFGEMVAENGVGPETE